MPAKSLDPAVRRRDKPVAREAATLPKCPTGIAGLDEITFGGLPRDRPTLVAGGPGCGKTLLALEFLVRGALNYREPGVFFSFEEPERDLVANVRSLGFDLADLERRKLLLVDHLQIERSEIQVTGEYDLRGPLHPARSGDQGHRRQARGARQRRVVVQRAARPRHPA